MSSTPLKKQCARGNYQSENPKANTFLNPIGSHSKDAYQFVQEGEEVSQYMGTENFLPMSSTVHQAAPAVPLCRRMGGLAGSRGRRRILGNRLRFVVLLDVA